MIPPLSVLVCGSVDDGKSTLIGRLLTDCGAVLEDQGAVELAHLTDGLEAERSRGSRSMWRTGSSIRGRGGYGC